MAPNISNRPQQVSALSTYQDYEYGRPQSPFQIQPPQPPGFDNELIMEVADVFDNMLFEEVATEFGFVVISTQGQKEEGFEIIEEVVDVFDNMIYDDGTETGMVKELDA